MDRLLLLLRDLLIGVSLCMVSVVLVGNSWPDVSWHWAAFFYLMGIAPLAKVASAPFEKATPSDVADVLLQRGSIRQSPSRQTRALLRFGLLLMVVAIAAGIAPLFLTESRARGYMVAAASFSLPALFLCTASAGIALWRALRGQK